ncbi:DoxX family protein [Spirosoma aerolatum]|uniref:DoxX family protein n=1 Tax=Spirosoma aerolatum TaxID=1211326 RepID=UPI0009AC698D|nr:DoxX family protein [Spirosoma aerolatum]
MNPKSKRIVTIVITVLAAGMVILSGIMKLTQSAQVMESLNKVGVGHYVILLGCMEIGFTLLYLYPKTMKLGFILLSCYFAGAIATELSHGTPFNALMPIVLIWISAFLRDKTMFLSTPTTM